MSVLLCRGLYVVDVDTGTVVSALTYRLNVPLPGALVVVRESAAAAGASTGCGTFLLNASGHVAVNT